MQKVEYVISTILNGRFLKRIIIRQYYKQKHPDINDILILELIKTLNGQIYAIDKENNNFQYIRAEPVFYAGKRYRLILVLDTKEDYLGVINAFRIRGKYE